MLNKITAEQKSWAKEKTGKHRIYPFFAPTCHFLTSRSTNVLLTPSRIPLPNFRLVAKMSSVPLFLRFPQKLHFCGSPKKKKMPSCTFLGSLPFTGKVSLVFFSVLFLHLLLGVDK